MATSGTVSTTVFRVGDAIDRAFGRCKLAPQQITGEYIEIAKQMLFLHLSSLGNEGIPLWCKTKQIYPIYEAFQNVPLQNGVIDVLSANLRTSTRLATGTPSSSAGIAANAFDGNLSTSCTLVAPAGFIQLQLAAPGNPSIFGFMPNVSGNWDYSFQASNDGVTWVTLFSALQQAVLAGQWSWTDIQGVPAIGYSFFRMLALNTTVLDVIELVFETAPVEVPMAKINMDDYANLSNKWFLGRPLQYWYDKQLPQPALTVWPAPQFQYTFNQIVTYVNRYIQDVGDMTNDVECPQRWLLAITTELARNLAMEIPEVKAEVLALLGPEADNQLKRAWASESDGSPTYLQPNISRYTR